MLTKIKKLFYRNEFISNDSEWFGTYKKVPTNLMLIIEAIASGLVVVALSYIILLLTIAME